MAALFRRSFPNEPLVREPLAQMQQQFAASRQAAGEFAPGDFIALSAALGEAWAEAGNDLRAIASLAYRDGLLELTLKPGARLSPETMQSAFAARRLQATPSPADPQRWQIRSR
jgi:hypothetical protein